MWLFGTRRRPESTTSKQRVLGAPGAQRRDPEVPGSSPASGSLHGACVSLCLGPCLSLSLYLSGINKYKAKRNSG